MKSKDNIRQKLSEKFKDYEAEPQDDSWAKIRFGLDLKEKFSAYEAEDPKTLQSAIQDINLRERNPIRYFEKIPGRNYSPLFIILAMLLISLLLFIKILSINAWRPSSLNR